ncbi:MAG: hypothetical protein ACE5F8_02650, partial [Woeseiaceae bacterium]
MRMLRRSIAIAGGFLITACAQQAVIEDDMLRVEGELPATFDGAWERDYARGDEANAVLNKIMYELARTQADLAYPGTPGVPSTGGISPQKRNAVLAIARLAELITRTNTLIISQTDNEISVEREEDFAIFCAFFNGAAKATETTYGREICGWDDANLISLLQLPDGLVIRHKFTVSDDHQQLRVITTVASSSSPAPFTLSRFYRRYTPNESEFRCVETLSMKRVCSTGDL